MVEDEENSGREPVIKKFLYESAFQGPRCSVAKFIDWTGNITLASGVCVICDRETPVEELTPYSTIPFETRTNHYNTPAEVHPFHDLYHGMLLHPPGITQTGSAQICDDCIRALKSDSIPMLALANKLWIGQIPHELAILMLPEQVLIAKYFPAAYVIKLFPKKLSAHHWDKCQMHSGLKGNVSTYRLDQSQISAMVIGSIFPQMSKILAAIIGVTFVGPKNLPERCMPSMFRVGRNWVREALEWLKANNLLYSNISISPSRLS
ncbi:hypothetical protein BYT27DRAFT_7225812 [Phlegmacium glaucopus]|nr:hypothetical protein BYT27DRAFT_7225812 [Phlegmacium glaucopus]